MKIGRGRSENDSFLAQKTFTGRVQMDEVLSVSGEVTVSEVLFDIGARTNWHRHPGGQVLVVKAGEGYVRGRTGETVKVRSGDVVHASPGEEHWHGGSHHSYLLHTSIALGTAEWLEPVDDEEYNRANA